MDVVDQVLNGELALPVTTVQEPFVDADDLADVAVAALTDERHIGRHYELACIGQATARCFGIRKEGSGYRSLGRRSPTSR